MTAPANASRIGINALTTYTSLTLGAAIDRLFALLPNNNTTSSSGAIAGGGFLDEVSPAATDQLMVEATALKAALLGTGIEDIAFGEYTITADDATANLANIDTGLGDLTLSRCAVSVWNGTTLATSDAVISEPSAGIIRVADGSTYNTVAGYVIRWMARKVAA